MRIFIAVLSLVFLSSCGDGAQQAVSATGTDADLTVAARTVDPANGRALFVDKGCVICHSVNGVGGKAAPPLDAPVGAVEVDPLDFAARMWLGAPAMIELQSVELGYTIFLTADEIADLAAFAQNRQQQQLLSAEALPETIQNGLLDEQFWEMEDWDGFLRDGRELDPDAGPDAELMAPADEVDG